MKAGHTDGLESENIPGECVPDWNNFEAADLDRLLSSLSDQTEGDEALKEGLENAGNDNIQDSVRDR